MRICTFCHRASLSSDLYCPYCGKTPYRTGRVCERGHRNPVEATYCTVCGSTNLSKVAPPVPLWWYLAGIVIGTGLLFLGWMILKKVLPILFLGVMKGILGVLIPFIVLASILFIVSLFLPKKAGRRARGGMGAVVLSMLKVIWWVVQGLGEIVLYLIRKRTRKDVRK